MFWQLARKREIDSNDKRRKDENHRRVQAEREGLRFQRITELTEHMKIHKKDNSTKRGLVALVNRRRRLLEYLEGEDYSRYSSLIKRLGIRH